MPYIAILLLRNSFILLVIAFLRDTVFSVVFIFVQPSEKVDRTHQKNEYLVCRCCVGVGIINSSPFSSDEN